MNMCCLFLKLAFGNKQRHVNLKNTKKITHRTNVKCAFCIMYIGLNTT